MGSTMNPLICFYENDQYILSTEYQLFSCPDNQSVSDFLKNFQSDYFENLKIVQINFEYENQTLFSEQKELYKSSKASVFILKSYSFHSMEELRKKFAHSANSSVNFNPLTTKNEFIEKLMVIKKEISEGRIYQVNLTSPLQATTEQSAFDLFFIFENKFQGHYKAFLPLSHCQVLCYSPELFLKKSADLLCTRPIKGSTGSDKDFNKNLYQNKKEDAELSMIVDLLRNDLNSLDENNAAQVTAHREKINLGYIQHTYSEITVENRSPLPVILEKLMPGGSISGCPKIESLKVISETEKYKRQIYTGSIGWWKQDQFCLNISIRTLIKNNNSLFYHAGCGIVHDSDPETEWQEFILKTGSLHVTA